MYVHLVFLSSCVFVTQKIKRDFEGKYVVSSPSKESAISAVCALTLRKKLFGFESWSSLRSCISRIVYLRSIALLKLIMVLCDREKA